MTPTKLLIGQIFVVFAIALAGIWFATQWAAASLAYQPELGPPWFIALGHPVYRPWSLFGWWFHFDAYAPRVFDKAGAIAGTSGFAGCAAAIVGSLWRARQRRNITTYGSARWASPTEKHRAGLFRDAGVFLGRDEGRYLRHDGPEHVMAFAPTRSGKGVGLVVPTLLGWTGSAVVHDIKGENWQLTAGWRARFSHCLLFNPTDARSAHYNPLLEVRRGAQEVTENIYDSATGRILLVPQGARLVGSYDSVVAFGQTRALVVWQRIVMPDGSSLRIDNVPATDPSGYAGLQDKVDLHTWQLLKGVALSTLLGVSSELALSGQSDLVQALRMSTQDNVSRAGDQTTQRNLGIQPTITIRPGAPVRLVVHKDLVLAPWHGGEN